MTEAYLQGDLDSLCGLYALINACNWGMRKSRPLSSREANALMRAMILHLDRTGDLPDALMQGLPVAALGRLSATARAWLNMRRSVELEVVRPFPRSRKAPPAFSVIRKLKDHLKADQTAAILLMRRRVQHWTVVTGVSALNLTLKDSEGDHRVPIAACTCQRVANQTPGMVRLVPHGVFLLTFQSRE